MSNLEKVNYKFNHLKELGLFRAKDLLVSLKLFILNYAQKQFSDFNFNLRDFGYETNSC